MTKNEKSNNGRIGKKVRVKIGNSSVDATQKSFLKSQISLSWRDIYCNKLLK